MITSSQNKLIVEVNKLKQKKYRELNQQFLVEGNHLVEEAYHAGVLSMVLYTDKPLFEDIDSYKVNDSIMSKLSEVSTNQGILGVCRMQSPALASHKVLLLDSIQDPGNMGTLIRSASGFGFKIVVLDQCVDIYNSKVIRSTQGAIFKIHFVQKDLLEYMEEFNEYTYIATELNTDHYLSDLDLPLERVGLILGNEGQGVRDSLIQKADRLVKIKMQGMESLNVGVAGSILMYELGGSK